jgi:hypothetical protein
MDYKKYLAIQCRDHLNSLPNGYMLELADANFKDIDEVLLSLANRLDSHLFRVNVRREPKMHKTITAQILKALMLSDLISKSAEEFESLDILKVLLEGATANNIFQEGDSVKIEMLGDNALKISGEQPRGNE